jgi:uncharacterized membrane protein (DUF373 family)
MSDRGEFETVTRMLDRSVKLLQTGIALFLVVVLVVGVVNLLATFVQAALAVEILGYNNAIGLISTTIDIVLYVFIVIELYRTIIAYVEAKNVVVAVIHAGLIAVVRQIITFNPQEVGEPRTALLTAGIYFVLLVGLLGGFFLVHWMDSESGTARGP